MIVIQLAVLVFLAGQPEPTFTISTVPTLKDCFEQAKKFVSQDPGKYNGIALGAGCIVKKGDKP